MFTDNPLGQYSYTDIEEGNGPQAQQTGSEAQDAMEALAQGGVLSTPWRWTSGHVQAIIQEIVQIFPDGPQNDRWYLEGESCDIAQGPCPQSRRRTASSQPAVRSKQARK